METVKLVDICSPKQWKTIAAKELKEQGKYPVYGANGIIGYYDKYNHESETVLITCRGATCGNIHITKGKAYINGNAMALDCLKEDRCLKKYLYYFLKYYNMKSVISGSAQPQITIQNLQRIDIKLYTLELQNNIVNKLDKIQKIINTRKKQIEELNELINSQFVEMFGDLKQNNKGWKYVDTIGNVCLLNPKKSELSNYSNIEVSFVSMQAISEKGDIDTSNIKLLEDVKLGFTYFKENDILFAKITPCMENGKGAVAKGLRNNIGFGSTEFHVIRPKEKINSIWLYTLTTLQSFRKEAEMKMSGSAGQKRVPIKFFEDYKIGIPPIELQNQFADIVRQINKQKIKLQDNLEEMKQLQGSLMNKYF